MLENFVERIKQYPAKEQVELKVRVKFPGSWFPGNLQLDGGGEEAEVRGAGDRLGAGKGLQEGGQPPCADRVRRSSSFASPTSSTSQSTLRARGLLDAADRLEPLQARHVQGGQGR